MSALHGRSRARRWRTWSGRPASARRWHASSTIISTTADADRNTRYRLRAVGPWRAWRGRAADDARAWHAGSLRPRRPWATDATGPDPWQPGPGPSVGAFRCTAGSSGNRDGAQPGAIAWRAITGCCGRMGDGADRKRGTRGAAPYATLPGAGRTAVRDRGRTVRQRLGCGARTLRIAAACRAWLRPGSR